MLRNENVMFASSSVTFRFGFFLSMAFFCFSLGAACRRPPTSSLSLPPAKHHHSLALWACAVLRTTTMTIIIINNGRATKKRARGGEGPETKLILNANVLNKFVWLFILCFSLLYIRSLFLQFSHLLLHDFFSFVSASSYCRPTTVWRPYQKT